MKQPELTLWYREPAPAIDDGAPFMVEKRGWERYALPLGNGYFGAAIFGRLETERIQITENSLAPPLSRMQTERFRGRGVNGLNNFAELYFDINHATADHYRRSLSLDTATASVSYRYHGVTHTRTVFASHDDHVLVVCFEADRPGSVTLGIRPVIPYLGPCNLEQGDGMGKSGDVTSVGDTITLRGETEYFGIRYEGQVRVLPEGGEMTTAAYAGRIWVDGADAVTVLFTCATNYRLTSRVFSEPDPKKKLAGYPDPHEQVSDLLAQASAHAYPDLLARHIADYTALFRRAQVALTDQVPALPTDELLARYRAGEEDRYLEMLLFQYGRYLLIASSRDFLPANLQGIWNPYASSPWSAGYWHNINVQMNYWASARPTCASCSCPICITPRPICPRPRRTPTALCAPPSRTARVRTEKTAGSSVRAASRT